MSKTQRDADLLDILRGQSDAGREWVEAATVTRIYNHRHQLGRDGLSRRRATSGTTC